VIPVNGLGSATDAHGLVLQARVGDIVIALNNSDYCSISFKSTLGVMRDQKNQFDISTTAKIWRDTSEIFDIKSKNLAFLGLTGNFEACVTLGRFDKRPRDA
jgi:hypothetical protein